MISQTMSRSEIFHPKIGQRHSNREAAPQPGVRQEDLAGPVDRVHEGHVHPIELLGDRGLVFRSASEAGR